MTEMETARVEERLRRLEEALESLPRAALAGGGWREGAPDEALAVGDLKLRGALADHTVNGREWLGCDGRAVSRSAYAALFAVIGTSFGAGDGSTTFNIPDLRRRFPIGAYSGAGGPALGASDGGAVADRDGEKHGHEINDIEAAAAGGHGHSLSGASQWPSPSATGGTIESSQTAAAGYDVIVPPANHTHGQNNHTHNLNGSGAQADSVGGHAHVVQKSGGGYPVTGDQTLAHQAVGFFILAQAG